MEGGNKRKGTKLMGVRQEGGSRSRNMSVILHELSPKKTYRGVERRKNENGGVTRWRITERRSWEKEEKRRNGNIKKRNITSYVYEAGEQ